jgi:hypothetical protein
MGEEKKGNQDDKKNKKTIILIKTKESIVQKTRNAIFYPIEESGSYLSTEEL